MPLWLANPAAMRRPLFGGAFFYLGLLLSLLLQVAREQQDEQDQQDQSNDPSTPVHVYLHLAFRRACPLAIALRVPSGRSHAEPVMVISEGFARLRSPARAPVAQWIERRPPEPKVAGSNPVRRAITTASCVRSPGTRSHGRGARGRAHHLSARRCPAAPSPQKRSSPSLTLSLPISGRRRGGVPAGISGRRVSCAYAGSSLERPCSEP